MKQLKLTIVLLFLGGGLYAQINECAVSNVSDTVKQSLPWFGNNQYLDDFMLNIANSDIFKGFIKKGGGCSESNILIPGRIILWQNGVENNEINSNLAMRIVEEANRRFGLAGIPFRIAIIDGYSTGTTLKYADGIDDFNEAQSLFYSTSMDDRLTINFTGNSRYALGQANMPQPLIYLGYTNFSKSLFVQSDFSAPNDTIPIDTLIYIQQIGGTLAHEVRHVLGLFHTHDPGGYIATAQGKVNAEQSFCKQELVNNSYKYGFFECLNKKISGAVNGDFLLDTPADPNMNRLNYNDSVGTVGACTYTIDFTEAEIYWHDRNGATWNPNPLNIMAYSNPRCRNFLSNGQKAIIRKYADIQFQNNYIQISGVSNIACTNTTAVLSFTKNIADITNVTWSVGSGITIISGNGTGAVNVRFTGTGIYSYITAQIKTASGTFCLRKDVWLGKPATPKYITLPVRVGEGTALFNAESSTPEELINQYTWTVSGGAIILGQGTTEVGIVPNCNNYELYVRVSATNTCGTSNNAVVYVPIICDGGITPQFVQNAIIESNNTPSGINLINETQKMSISPNPGSGYFNIEVPISKMNENKLYLVRIFSLNNQVLYSDIQTSNRFELNVSFLQKGLYMVQVINGSITYNQNVIIK